MQVHSSPGVYEGEFPVSMNPGDKSGAPFGVLPLGRGIELSDVSDEDADRLIRAAVRIKEMRAGIGTPHEHRPGAGEYGGNCEKCGLLAHSHATAGAS